MAINKRKEVAEADEKPSPRRTRSASARAATGTVSLQKPEPTKKKAKPSKEEKKPAKMTPTVQKVEEETEPVEGSRAIIIEACKQCNSFKTRALKVKEGLEKRIPGIIVKINPEKPRRGCFEVRKGSGETFLSLLGMPRPFKKMKELDMDKVTEDIIDKLKD